MPQSVAIAGPGMQAGSDETVSRSCVPPAPRGDGVLRVSEVTVKIPAGPRVLESLALEVAAGEHVAVVGPSGAGKTTLLNVLAGKRKPDAGVVERRGDAGRVYQDHRLVDRATALTNVLHGAAGRRGRFGGGLSERRELRREALAMLQRMGLAARAAVRVDRLSGGERQRVAIGRALMARPAVLLADEPVSALDDASARGVMELLATVCREREVALVSVLHDRRLADAYADRVLKLNDGMLTPAVAGVREHARGDHESSREASDSNETRAIAVALPNEPGGLGSATKWAVGLAITAAAVLASVWVTDLGDVRWGRTFDNISRIASSLLPTAGELRTMDWPHLAHSFAQTLGMAVLGTAAAITWSLPLAALGAKNVAPPWLRWPVRIVLNAIRSVPSILWALVCVGAMGLGAWSGIVALAAYSTGYLTKFFYEAFESVDDKTPAALRDLGMSGVGSFVSAIWPASRLAAASSCVFMLEYNFRAASVLGVVGAGGIGYDLRLAVEWGNWHVVGVILAVLAVSVFVFDTAAGLARRALR